MPYTLPLLVAQVDHIRPAASGRQTAEGVAAICPGGSLQPTLIISIQEGCVGAARGADFLVPADLAAEVFFAADIARNGARK